LYKKDAMGGGAEELLVQLGPDALLQDWSRDGRYLLYQLRNPKTSIDLWGLPMDGDRKPFPVLQGPRANLEGQISPDGRWIVSVSTDAGAGIYVRPFAGRGAAGAGRWQVSTGGSATHPRWRGDGKEIYYQSRGSIYAVGIRLLASAVEADVPRELFRTPAGQPVGLYAYDVTADGQRFLALEPADSSGDRVEPLTVVVNWQAGLKR